MPLLGKYFGKFAPLHAVIACTDFSTHAALYHRDEEEEDDDGNDVAVRVGSGRGNQGAESVNAAKKVEGEAGDRGGSSGGASDMPVLAYREQFELADIVVWVDEAGVALGSACLVHLHPAAPPPRRTAASIRPRPRPPVEYQDEAPRPCRSRGFRSGVWYAQGGTLTISSTSCRGHRHCHQRNHRQQKGRMWHLSSGASPCP